jgi:hypothetical protein
MSLIQSDLGELIRIIQTNGNKQANSLFAIKEKDTIIRRLARKFAFEKNRDEHAWALEICGESEHSISYTWHRSLLRRELLDQVFHFEIQSGPQRRKATYKLLKSIFLIRTLLLFGARRTAISLVPAAMKIAMEYELTADRIHLLDTLCSNASLNGWRLKFERYSHELHAMTRLRLAEVEITALDRQIDLENIGRARPSEYALQLAKTAPHKALELFRDFPTFNVGIAYFRIATSAAQMIGDFKRGLTLYEDAQAFLSRFPKLYTVGTKGEFELNRLSMALASGSFQAAAEIAVGCQKLFLEGANNWFIAQEYEFLLLMHTKQWRKAIALHQLVVTQSRFPSQPDHVKQKWELFGHYAALIPEVGKMHSTVIKSNDFEKLLREVPIYHRDKEGYNTSLLILQYLILASNGDIKALTEKSGAMAKFVYRNFRGRHDGQTFAFLKALLFLNNSDFDVKKAKTRAKRYIEVFNAIGNENVDETQILPFEVMWDWVTNWIKIANSHHQ